jgi:hypothetical protein
LRPIVPLGGLSRQPPPHGGGGAGGNGYGTVFEIQNTGTAAAPVYARVPPTLAVFNGSNGQAPVAGLTADASGNLFGTTASGEAYGSGTVFEIRSTGSVSAPVYASAPTTLNEGTFDIGNGSLSAATIELHLRQRPRG